MCWRSAPCSTLRCANSPPASVAFARLVAAPRPLWLLDEPFAPLDANWREALGIILKAHLDRGGAVVAAVHDPLPVTASALDIGGVR